MDKDPEWRFQPTPQQKARYERMLLLLRARKVPTLSYALCVNDESETTLRSSEEVAQRMLVLWAVTLLADGMTSDEVLPLIEQYQLWPALSPKERHFVTATDYDPEQAGELLWRLECLQVLLWAIGDMESLDWPAGMCNVAWLAERMNKHASSPHFVRDCQLRNPGEIIDESQFILLLHWAIRESWIHQHPVPEDLDWSGKADMVAVSECAAALVVQERHHVLNWLTCFGDADWDDVDTPT